jgi:hypothetical protein
VCESILESASTGSWKKTDVELREA